MENATMVKDSVSTPLHMVNKEFEKFGENINYEDPKKDYTTLILPKATPTP